MMHDPLVVVFDVRLVTVWHREPGGADSGSVCNWEGRWRWHIHHWRIQIPPLRALRRRLLTRCTWCGGRDSRGDPVDVSHQWDGPRGQWWRGEPGLFHHDCSAVKSSRSRCLCTVPVLVEPGMFGRCLMCGKGRYGEIPDLLLKRLRLLASVPENERDSGFRGADTVTADEPVPAPGEPTPGQYRGQFGLTKIRGAAGFWIRLGQFIAGDDSPFSHAFLVLDDSTVVEAEPGGARIVPLAGYLGRADTVFSRITLTEQQKLLVMDAGRGMEGCPYAWGAYLAMGLNRCHVEWPWLLAYLESSKQRECAQLVDIAYQIGGVQLFDDQLPPGLVSPGDLTVCLYRALPAKRPRKGAK